MTTRADAYAEGLLGVARAEGLSAELEDELFRFARTVEGSDELRMALGDPALPPENRLGIVEELLGKKALPLTKATVGFVVAAGRGSELVAIVDRLVERAAETREHEVAEVRSALPLDEEQQRRLAEALSHATRKQVEVKVIVDPEVLGGLVARVGDTVIDGTVRHRLDQLKEQS